MHLETDECVELPPPSFTLLNILAANGKEVIGTYR